MKKNYINLYFKIKEELQDLAIGYLVDTNFSGAEQKGDELIISFSEEFWNDELKDYLIQSFKNLDEEAELLSEKKVEEENWNEEWEKSTPIIVISEKITIVPEWKKDLVNCEIPIIINPKMSFGTGSHSTTRMMCKLIEKYSNPKKRWIDAGTGTGVLSILEAKLGAEYVLAFDNNYWAVVNAKENAKLNNVENIINITEEDIHLIDLPETDYITANLYTHLIQSAFPKFYKALEQTKGYLIVSGILTYDKGLVLADAKKQNFNVVEVLEEDEWIAICFRAN